MPYQSQLNLIHQRVQQTTTRKPNWTWANIINVYLPAHRQATISDPRFSAATNPDFLQYRSELQIWRNLWGQPPAGPPFPGIAPPMHLPPAPTPPAQPQQHQETPEEREARLQLATQEYLNENYMGSSLDALDQAMTLLHLGPQATPAPPPVDIRRDWIRIAHANVAEQDRMAAEERDRQDALRRPAPQGNPAPPAPTSAEEQRTRDAAQQRHKEQTEEFNQEMLESAEQRQARARKRD